MILDLSHPFKPAFDREIASGNHHADEAILQSGVTITKNMNR